MLYVDGSGQPVIRIFREGGWHAPAYPGAAISYSAAEGRIDARIHKDDLGIGYPQPVTMTLATFRGSGNDAGSDATYDSPDNNNDAIDVMGGEPGVPRNAWGRDLSDNTIGYHYRFMLDSGGAAAKWIGSRWSHFADGEIDASSDLRLNVRSWPQGGFAVMELAFSVNGGAWTGRPMSIGGQAGAFDEWTVNLGRLSPGSVVRYAFRGIEPGGNVIWDTNEGADYYAQVNATARDGDGDGIPDWWMLDHFGHADPRESDRSRAQDDADGDGQNNLAEYLAGTGPGNPASRFAVTGVVRQAGGAFTITWSSVPGKVYQVQAALSPAGPYSPSGGVIQATGSSASYTDPQPSGSHGFYRVAVVP
jgi:hypothetical protein